MTGTLTGGTMGIKNLLAAAATGAGVTYAMSGERGQPRRDWLKKKATGAGNATATAAAEQTRLTLNRARGLAIKAVARLRGAESTDEVVEARVRSALGRAAGHPGSIHVHVSRGEVTLSGPALEDEVDDILETVSVVRGV